MISTKWNHAGFIFHDKTFGGNIFFCNNKKLGKHIVKRLQQKKAKNICVVFKTVEESHDFEIFVWIARPIKFRGISWNFTWSLKVFEISWYVEFYRGISWKKRCQFMMFSSCFSPFLKILHQMRIISLRLWAKSRKIISPKKWWKFMKLQRRWHCIAYEIWLRFNKILMNSRWNCKIKFHHNPGKEKREIFVLLEKNGVFFFKIMQIKRRENTQ